MAGNNKSLEVSLAERRKLLEWLHADGKAAIHDIAAGLTECLRAGGTVFTCGNGGSASQAEHFAAELMGRFKMDRKPLRAHAFSTNSSTMTAVSNDYGFSEVFSRQLEGAAVDGDCLLAISTSGTSPNVVKACRKAREMGVRVFALTGGADSEVAAGSRTALKVPDRDTARIQEIHLIALHLICQTVEEDMFSPKPARSRNI